MVKLFIGNLPREATEQEIRSLFEQYGKVMECDIIKNYGFVHIEDKTAAEDATRNLHHHKLHGVCINVEASKNKSKASTKLHVGSISPTCTNLELRAKFEEYGPVIECDIVKDYAFVHMERAEDAVEAIRGLDNTEFQDFCWMCLGDWKTHGSEYYECSRYKENPDIVNQSQQAQAREALKKYLFYFERWENHNKSLQLEAQTYQRIQEKIQERVMNNLGTWIDWQYLQNAAKLLAKCRYTLQYTYPYAYYMESGPRKKLDCR